MVRIDPEFAALCPPLSVEEAAQLEANILAEGCRDALVVWDDVLLDGHNRKRICDRHGLPYDTMAVTLPDREAAIDWILRNQLGRRNLHPDAASLMRGRLYNRQKRERGGTGANQYTEQKYQSDTSATAERLSAELGVSAPTIKRDGKFAEAVDTLRPVLPDIDNRIMAGDIPSRQAVVDAAKEPEKAPHLLISQSISNEWYTPREYIEAAREVMGGIDCDPASNDMAQRWIGAATHYTAETDGLAQEWHGRIWLNPPYGRLAGDFITKLAYEMAAGRVAEVIVLVNAHATDAQWFQILWDGMLCFTNHRINFESPSGNGSGSTHGSVFVYFGPHKQRFVDAFSPWGTIVEKVHHDYPQQRHLHGQLVGLGVS